MKDKEKENGMAKYMIEFSLTTRECLEALEMILAKGPEVLNKFVWGYAQGVHIAWACIDADNKKAIYTIIPEFLQEKAKITEVNIFTPEHIRSFYR
jgi:hypothetical protein